MMMCYVVVFFLGVNPAPGPYTIESVQRKNFFLSFNKGSPIAILAKNKPRGFIVVPSLDRKVKGAVSIQLAKNPNVYVRVNPKTKKISIEAKKPGDAAFDKQATFFLDTDLIEKYVAFKSAAVPNHYIRVLKNQFRLAKKSKDAAFKKAAGFELEPITGSKEGFFLPY